MGGPYNIDNVISVGDPGQVQWGIDVADAVNDLHERVADHRAPIDQTPLDPTYGDEFDGASLDAKWTRVNIVSGDETYQDGETGSFLRVLSTGTPAERYYTQPVPAGDFDAVLSMRQFSESSQMMSGLGVIDGSNNGYMISTYDGPGMLLGSVSSGAYGGAFSSLAPNAGASFSVGQPMWFRVSLVGTTYTFRVSTDGTTWSTGLTRTGFTATKFMVGRMYGATQAQAMLFDRFNVL